MRGRCVRRRCGGRYRQRPARCTVYRPDIDGLLPVYVMDRYEGIQARTFADCDKEQVRRYIDANVGGGARGPERVQPQAALANHLIMGPVILARALAGAAPYAVKVHGSALEYTVEFAHPELQTPDSPTQRVGGEPAAQLHQGPPPHGDAQPQQRVQPRRGPRVRCARRARDRHGRAATSAS